MLEEKLLTTIDNPYNPFSNWDEWYTYDITKGYFTCGLLARFAISSDSLSEPEKRTFLQDAMKRIIAIDSRYKMIGKDEEVKPVSVESLLH